MASHYISVHLINSWGFASLEGPGLGRLDGLLPGHEVWVVRPIFAEKSLIAIANHKHCNLMERDPGIRELRNTKCYSSDGRVFWQWGARE